MRNGAVKLDRRRDADDYAQRMYNGVHAASSRRTAEERIRRGKLGPAKGPDSGK
jgi:hypothetical protein